MKWNEQSIVQKHQNENWNYKNYKHQNHFHSSNSRWNSSEMSSNQVEVTIKQRQKAKTKTKKKWNNLNWTVNCSKTPKWQNNKGQRSKYQHPKNHFHSSNSRWNSSEMSSNQQSAITKNKTLIKLSNNLWAQNLNAKSQKSQEISHRLPKEKTSFQ